MSPVVEPCGGERGQPVAKGRFLHTRWEVLVIAVVAAVLFTLLPPAIQSAREAARRGHCINNLKQIALAIHNYGLAQRVLPPGTVCTTKAKMPGQYDVLGEAAQAGPGFQGTGFLLRTLFYSEPKDKLLLSGGTGAWASVIATRIVRPIRPTAT